MLGNLLNAVIQTRSTRRAQDAQARADAASLEEQRRQFDLNQQRQTPFFEAGKNAVGQLTNYQFRAPTQADVAGDPGYSFGLGEGQKALENSAAARGRLFSGDTGKRLLKYGNDYATTKYNDAFERAKSLYNTNTNTLFNLANLGSGSAAQLGNSGANYARSVGDIYQRGAESAGGASIARGNIWSDAINQATSMGKSALSGFAFKDGGPVMEERDGRMVPKVGTRSPRRGGTSGGLSDENLVRALVVPEAASAPAPRFRTLREMQIEKALKDAGAYADGGQVMDRQAILDQLTAAQQGYKGGGCVKRKNYKKGGDVKGPGGPKDDAIPAWLSNGEHVIEAEVVDKIGGGDNKQGQKVLNKVRALLKEC